MAAIASTVGNNILGTFNNVLGRVADLYSLDFLASRGIIGNQQPETIPAVTPVQDIAGPQLTGLSNPFVIGGIFLGSAVILALVLRR